MATVALTWEAARELGPWCQQCGLHTRHPGAVKLRSGRGDSNEVLYDFDPLCPVCSDEEAKGG